jgi:hypothetical protein
MACAAKYEVTNSWPGGYQAQVPVRGNDQPSLNRWSVRWELPADGALSQHGSSVTVTNAAWNATPTSDGSTTFGLIATRSGTDLALPALRCQSP